MSEEKVLATVAGKQITEADVTAYISTMPAEQQKYANVPQFRQQVLNQLVSIELFARMGADEKLDETEEFAKILEAAKRDILAQLAISKVVSGITVTDEEAKEYFRKNPAKFAKGATVAAKHILVETEEKCREILADLKAGVVAFEDAAKQHSTCPSKEQGGDLGEFGRGAMVPEFDKAAFDAKVGEIVGPVKTQFGYHLIQVYKKNEANTPAFDSVSAQIKNTLLQQKQNEAYSKALNELGQKYVG